MGEVTGVVLHNCLDMFYNYSAMDNLQNETNLDGIKRVLLIPLHYIEFGGILCSFSKIKYIVSITVSCKVQLFQNSGLQLVIQELKMISQDSNLIGPTKNKYQAPNSFENRGSNFP